MPDTDYAFDIHKYGTLTGGCDNVGPSFLADIAEPLGELHKHSIGSASNRQRNYEVKLYGSQSIIGRSCVVHADNSSTVACGVVALAEFSPN